MTADDLLQQLEERRRSSISAYHIVTADEVAKWPDGLLTQLLAKGVLDETTPAISAECTACDEGHAELVQIVEEPPGSALRHYISCPEIGRVRIDPASLRRWCVFGPEGETEALRRAQGCPCGLEHSDNFRWVKSDIESFSLTVPQARVVGLLHEAFLDGRPEMTWPQIAGELHLSAVNLSQVFKDERRWRTLIAKSRRNLYRLRDPTS